MIGHGIEKKEVHNKQGGENYLGSGKQFNYVTK
jgi:hypothetical protein